METFGSRIGKKRKPNEELSEVLRALILQGVSVGKPKAALAREMHVSVATVYYTVKRHAEREKFQSKLRSGAPKALSKRDIRSVLRIARLEPDIQYKELMECAGLAADACSRQIIRKALEEAGLRNRNAYEQSDLPEAYAATSPTTPDNTTTSRTNIEPLHPSPALPALIHPLANPHPPLPLIQPNSGNILRQDIKQSWDERNLRASEAPSTGYPEVE